MSYDSFFAWARERCRCVDGPCDGVLAGGLCDGHDEDWELRQWREWYEDEWDKSEQGQASETRSKP